MRFMPNPRTGTAECRVGDAGATDKIAIRIPQVSGIPGKFRGSSFFQAVYHDPGAKSTIPTRGDQPLRTVLTLV
jgi:hypothetical protein